MSETRWLSDDQQHAWRRLAAVLDRLPALLERQMQHDAGITVFEYWIMAMLSEEPTRTLQLNRLAARSNASASRLSHVVKRLEGRGWVERQPCPGDARATNAVLTDAGWDKVLEAAPGHAGEVLDLVFDGLDDRDVADLSRICDAILERLAASPQGTGPIEL